ncbi:hypothetical protein [Yersinia mollaretii]|nr:hypothetical protein [Yersinia mollaretii]MDA5534859.1 hypothetical protein [Yersinia mollaretii]
MEKHREKGEKGEKKCRSGFPHRHSEKITVIDNKPDIKSGA